MRYKGFTISRTTDTWAPHDYEATHHDLYDVDYDGERLFGNEFHVVGTSIEDIKNQIDEIVFDSVYSTEYTAENFELGAFEAIGLHTDIFFFTCRELINETLSALKKLFS